MILFLKYYDQVLFINFCAEAAQHSTLTYRHYRPDLETYRHYTTVEISK